MTFLLRFALFLLCSHLSGGGGPPFAPGRGMVVPGRRRVVAQGNCRVKYHQGRLPVLTLAARQRSGSGRAEGGSFIDQEYS
jgi:hypothetical protein